MHTALIFGFLAVIEPTALAAQTEPVHDIGVTADVPTVTVTARLPGATDMRLPSVTYALTVAADCDANWRPDSVSISIADSRAFLDAEQLQSGGELILELRIPSNQIAPLRIENFCIDGYKGKLHNARKNRVTVPGVMSVQASLRCATESAQSIRYVTVPLDVVLECDAKESPND